MGWLNLSLLIVRQVSEEQRRVSRGSSKLLLLRSKEVRVEGSELKHLSACLHDLHVQFGQRSSQPLQASLTNITLSPLVFYIQTAERALEMNFDWHYGGTFHYESAN